jgi:hypothetical protein
VGGAVPAMRVSAMPKAAENHFGTCTHNSLYQCREQQVVRCRRPWSGQCGFQGFVAEDAGSDLRSEAQDAVDRGDEQIQRPVIENEGESEEEAGRRFRFASGVGRE